MDPISIIVMALATGAAEGLKPTAEKAVKDAYAGIKKLIQRKYDKVNIDKIEDNPSSKVIQDNIKEELEKANVGKDEELLNQTKIMFDTINEYAPDVAKDMNINLSIVRIAITLNIELQGLYSIREIQTLNLYSQEEEKAKYGGIGVPPRLTHSIEDIKREINRTDAKITELEKKLSDYK